MLQNSYGITLKEWNSLFSSQKYRCAICQTDKKNGNGWHTDHNHKTGKIRKILCARCNSMLGYSLDNPETLRNGAIYLEFYQ